MNFKFQKNIKYEISYTFHAPIPTSLVPDLRYSSNRHSSLSLGRHRTPLYVPAPLNDLSTADESWQSGIMFEGTGARYREEWAARVLVASSSDNSSK